MAVAPSPWRACVAPMLDWTDRHCRYFHRLLSRHARLYTEMVTTGALLHGDQHRHLDFNEAEHPVALQLGGSDPTELAACAKWAQKWGYDEVNLNCGCPSPRVQRGAFGACLMAEPQLVAQCVAAMRDASTLPITVKHRIGIDRIESYDFVRDFVGTVAQAGCHVFIVHARSAWLEGLSPKENREIPPLRYDLAQRLKVDFPALTVVLNGGLKGREAIHDAMLRFDGVMVGREAYHDPWSLTAWDQAYFAQATPGFEYREQAEAAMVRYMIEQHDGLAVPWPHIARHILGLWNGQAGARAWRRVWSDHRLRSTPPQEVMELARRARLGLPSAD